MVRVGRHPGRTSRRRVEHNLKRWSAVNGNREDRARSKSIPANRVTSYLDTLRMRCCAATLTPFSVFEITWLAADQHIGDTTGDQHTTAGILLNSIASDRHIVGNTQATLMPLAPFDSIVLSAIWPLVMARRSRSGPCRQYCG